MSMFVNMAWMPVAAPMSMVVMIVIVTMAVRMAYACMNVGMLVLLSREQDGGKNHQREREEEPPFRQLSEKHQRQGDADKRCHTEQCARTRSSHL
ncbi:hypothetical protein IH601_07420, partial [Candidatus Bipolaricaulota bacterium]|nr:hypothetical protein [Candidatus Bipolaricaulota bacterium]